AHNSGTRATLRAFQGPRDSLAGKARPAFESRDSGSMRGWNQPSNGISGAPGSATLKGIAIAGLTSRADALPTLYGVGRLALQEAPQHGQLRSQHVAFQHGSQSPAGFNLDAVGGIVQEHTR